MRTFLLLLAFAAPAYAADTQITSSTSSPTGSDTISVSFSSSTNQFECQLNNQGYSACSSPYVASSLEEGSYKVSVRSVELGVPDPTPAEVTIRLDHTPPETTVTSAPGEFTNDQQPEFSFRANEVSTFECRIDGGAWAECTSPYRFTSLSDGVYGFEVRAVDQAGNQDDTSVARSFVVDTQAPSTQIVVKPKKRIGSERAYFRFKADEAVSFECSLNRSEFSLCSEEHELIGLKTGSQFLRVRAVDLAGNQDLSTASYRFLVRLPSPQVAIRPSIKKLGESLYCRGGLWTQNPGLRFKWLVNGIAYKTGPRVSLKAAFNKRVACKVAATSKLGEKSYYHTSYRLIHHDQLWSFGFPKELRSYKRRVATRRQLIKARRWFDADQQYSRLPAFSWWSDGYHKLSIRILCDRLTCQNLPNFNSRSASTGSQLRKFYLSGRPGLNRFSLKGQLPISSLKAGRYRLVLRYLAKTSGGYRQSSGYLTRSFRIR